MAGPQDSGDLMGGSTEETGPPQVKSQRWGSVPRPALPQIPQAKLLFSG